MKRAYKLKKDSLDLRDSHYQSKSIIHPKDLPTMINLGSQCSPVVDQGQLGSCTANAIASGLREYLILQAKQPLVRLSRLFLYYYERKLEGTVKEDSGASIRDGMKVLKNIGVCPESDDPYNIAQYTQPPTIRDILDAFHYRINQYYRVKDLTMLKASLVEGLPVVIGIMVYESFESDAVAKTGIVPMPSTDTEQLFGGHAALVVGYDDSKQWAIVRNSWGSNWGDKGYFYLPYLYWAKDLVTDMWTGK
ncbi:MAG: C1 family peptidase [Desulfitobacterium hafniense]|nr:C1 family peptidase [Desulfitobacterium hafniense]